MNASLRNPSFARLLWWLYGVLLAYLIAFQLWLPHHLPGNVSGTRIKSTGGHEVAAFAELFIIILPLLAFFVRPRLAALMLVLTLAYFVFVLLTF